ncbi:hypothetical protein [Microbulbifer sp. GL-2]|uniref:hypothetical protein n=1 Tax=Microbulbifer sp. GL-2 TaxID=2591606 RepID=UPI00116275C2|nr:hypothetical protein [Microbulbifer sp. GL-2]BBM03251.1 hypothetical protein GL2_33250 [Microbulbifer sp. GL-2]
MKIYDPKQKKDYRGAISIAEGSPEEKFLTDMSVLMMSDGRARLQSGVTPHFQNEFIVRTFFEGLSDWKSKYPIKSGMQGYSLSPYRWTIGVESGEAAVATRKVIIEKRLTTLNALDTEIVNRGNKKRKPKKGGKIVGVAEGANYHHPPLAYPPKDCFAYTQRQRENSNGALEIWVFGIDGTNSQHLTNAAEVAAKKYSEFCGVNEDFIKQLILENIYVKNLNVEDEDFVKRTSDLIAANRDLYDMVVQACMRAAKAVNIKGSINFGVYSDAGNPKINREHLHEALYKAGNGGNPGVSMDPCRHHVFSGSNDGGMHLEHASNFHIAQYNIEKK